MKHLLTRERNYSLGFRSMIELIEQTALTVAKVGFGLSGTLFLVGASLKKIRDRKNQVDLPVYQDLPARF